MLNITDILDKLYCCYNDSLSLYINNKNNLIKDVLLESKVNQLFNLLSIYENINYNNNEEVDKYISQIKTLCGECECFKPLFISENDSETLNYDEIWIPICHKCIEEKEKWIGINQECEIYSTCTENITWIGVNQECIIENTTLPINDCECNYSFKWIGINIICN